jgi:hypothetical protein
MQERYKANFDMIWQNLNIGQSWPKMLSVPMVYFKFTDMDAENGHFKGKALWMNKAAEFSLKLAITDDVVNMDCGCHAMRSATHGMEPPCQHIMRALITLEGKVLKEDFEKVYWRRLEMITPF